MPETGVIQEQGFVTEDRGLGFSPLKEGEADPFTTPKKEDNESSNK